MDNRFDRLRFVILESPYSCWNHPIVEDLFARTLGMKLRGYGKEYPHGVLAVDTTDFIADHLLVCEETDDGLRPIHGFKSINFAKCGQFHLRFPGLSIPQDAGAHDHVKSIEQVIAKASASGADLRYTGSWTAVSKHRGDKEWKRMLLETFIAIYTHFHLGLKKPIVISGGTIRFKVDNHLQLMGHEPLRLGDQILEPISVKHLAGEKVRWLVLEEFTFAARRTAKNFDHLWKNHIRIKAGEGHGIFEQMQESLKTRIKRIA